MFRGQENVNKYITKLSMGNWLSDETQKSMSVISPPNRNISSEIY